jgi:ketosteroid isomerase-like protein
MKRSVFNIALILALATVAFAQNTNSSQSVRPRTATANTNTAPKPKATPSQTATAAKKRTTAEVPGSDAVLAAFNKILDGIRHANVNQVTAAYWNSRQLILFNNNGSVTRGWEQLRKNREASYADLKDVKLDVREVHVLMLGRDGAIVTCLWTQAQTAKGAPETASGRMTLVFKRVGTEWKAVHLHTSPDAPSASRVLPSEQTHAPSPTPKP